MKSTRKIVNLALLVAMALAVSLIEQMIPLPVAIPGAKLGLSNIVILTTICLYDFKASMTVSILKSFLLMLVTGSVSSFLYSLTGAVLSTIAMNLAVKKVGQDFSLIGVSEIGSFFHNFGQIIVAITVMNNIKVIYYFPLLVLIGVFTGYFVGLSSNYIVKHMKKIGGKFD